MMTFYEANKEGKKKTYKGALWLKINKMAQRKKKNQISFKCYNMKYLILEE